MTASTGSATEGVRIGVVGATGQVGAVVRRLLEERAAERWSPPVAAAEGEAAAPADTAPPSRPRRSAGPGPLSQLVTLARRYTRDHRRDFWVSDLFDHSVHDRWEAGGSSTLRKRVGQRTRELLETPREFELPVGVPALLMSMALLGTAR